VTLDEDTPEHERKDLEAKERAQAQLKLALAKLPVAYQTDLARLQFDLAMKAEPPEDTFERYGYSPAESLKLLENQAFAESLQKITDEVVTKGVSFRLKAKAMAEDLLPQAYIIASDASLSAAVRSGMIQWITRIAGLEPPKVQEGEGEKAPGAAFVLNIQFAGQAPEQVLVTERHISAPVTIEQ
jgi:polyhydroxyalkanoate synthesis regulator phasin